MAVSGQPQPHPPSPSSRLRRVFGLDPRSLALFRIGLGLLVLANLAGRASVFAALYGDGGVLPQQVVARVAPWWPTPYFAYMLDGSGPALAAVALASVGFALLLVLGLYTRLATTLSWFLLVSLNTRNFLATSYEDYVLMLLLFFGIFLPLGARFSLDARGKSESAPTEPVVSGGSVALLIQFGCIYLFAALLKTGAAWHSEGSAVAYAMSQNYVGRSFTAAALEHAELLAFLTHVTWIWELLVPFMLLSPVWNGPVRSFAVGSIWAFHAGLGIFMALFLFPWVMGVGALALLPAWAWERLSLARATPVRRPKPEPGVGPNITAWIGHGLPLAALAYVLASNLASLSAGSELPGLLRRVGQVLPLDQKWAMYAPSPERWDYFYVVPGTLADGGRVDLLRGGRPFSIDPPSSLPWRGPSRPWGLYLDHARVHRQKGPGLGLASWYCRSWNEDHHGEERLLKLEWIQVRFDLAHDRAREDRRLGAWSCPASPAGLTRPIRMEP
jgi:hypothetical protein